MLLIIWNWNKNKKVIYTTKATYVLKIDEQADWMRSIWLRWEVSDWDEKYLSQVEHFSHISQGRKVSHSGEASHLLWAVR